MRNDLAHDLERERYLESRILRTWSSTLGVEEEKRYCSLFLQYKFIYFNWRRDIIVLMEKTHRVTHKVEFDRNCKAFPGLPLGKWKV